MVIINNVSDTSVKADNEVCLLASLVNGGTYSDSHKHPN